MSEKNPRHIALIMDGNRRWARREGYNKLYGHKVGLDRLTGLTDLFIERSIPYMTVYALSTENWRKRSDEEVSNIFDLMVDIASKIIKSKKQVRVKPIGKWWELPERVAKVIGELQEATADREGLTLQIGLNYGGRDEIRRACQQICSEGYDASQLSEEGFSEYLDTAGVPDPDLIVRTGGDNRLSGFLTWQSTYAELYFSDKFWPEFDEAELDRALGYFTCCQRRFGK